MSIKKARETLQNKGKFNYDILDKVANSGKMTGIRYGMEFCPWRFRAFVEWSFTFVPILGKMYSFLAGPCIYFGENDLESFEKISVLWYDKT